MEDELTNRIEEAVDVAKMDAEGRWNFMTLYEKEQEKLEQGRVEGANLKLYKLVSKGFLTCRQACREAEPPVDEETFRQNMTEAGFTPAM